MSEKNKFLMKMMRRKTAYRVCFDNRAGQQVLTDLKRFCYATKPTFSENNPHLTAYREGRREVFLRIQQHLNITDEQLHKMIEERA